MNHCIKAVAPSNIALMKYWGKSNAELQWPATDSLSMSLHKAKTTTRVRLSEGAEDRIWFAGKLLGPQGTFAAKPRQHLRWMRSQEGLEIPPLDIDTYNSFPASAGIASSASSMAALTLAAVAIYTGSENFEDLERSGFGRTRLAHLARMGSGSAGRSLWGGYVQWRKGESPKHQDLRQIREDNHLPLVNLIALVSDKAKPVGSSEAHASAWSSPLFSSRVAGYQERFAKFLIALHDRDFGSLGDLMEADCIEMHAIAMTGQNSVCYLHKATTQIMTWVRTLRRTHHLPVFFTIDAGPNVHLLMPPDVADEVKANFKERFTDIPLFVDGVGSGPYLDLDAANDWPIHV